MSRPEKLDPAEVARVANEINETLNAEPEPVSNVVSLATKPVVREDEAVAARHLDGDQSQGPLTVSIGGTIYDFTAPHGIGTFAMFCPGGKKRLFCIIEAVTFTAEKTYYDIQCLSGYRSTRVEPYRIQHLTSREVTELATVGNMLQLRTNMHAC